MSAVADSAADRALLDLLRLLAERGYAFVAPTPATHARVLARPDRQRARALRDVLGWSLPFRPEVLDPDVLALLERAEAIEATPEGLKSRYRVSSLHGRLFLHSAYPTTAEDAVFFGPDSYRFADFIATRIGAPRPGARIVDIGTGAGVGAIVAAGLAPGAKVLMTDVNPKALRLARINAAFAGVAAEVQQVEGLEGVAGEWDVALTNPPYIADAAGREYRDGGDMHGDRLSLQLASAAAERLAPGGRLLLYTGAAIVEGADPLKTALGPALAARGCDLDYRELDPDVFGEELANPPYADVERIAVVGAVALKSPPRP